MLATMPSNAANPESGTDSPAPRALAPVFYTSLDLARAERSRVFARAWQFVAHVSSLRSPGDAVASEIVGAPVLVLRDGEGTLRAFVNVCRHRAAPLLKGQACGLTRLRCGYHGWTYELDGRLRTVCEPTTMGPPPDADTALYPLQLACWRGLIFVAEDPSHRFDELVEGLDERMGERDLASYVHFRRVNYELACNWKVYVDNYLEGYHVPHLHPELNALLDYRTYITTTARYSSLQYSPLESSGDVYRSGDALYYHLWPNVMLNSLPDRLQTNRVIPLAPDRCRVEFDFYYPPHVGQDIGVEAVSSSDAQVPVGGTSGSSPAVLDPRADPRLRDVEFSDLVQAQDAGVCEDVQRGLASGHYQGGRLHALRENAVFAFQQLVRDAMSDLAPNT